MAPRLLAWYDVASPRAALARAGRESAPIPIEVWLSEIMLQQTTVQAVAGYYRKFLKRWPDVNALAAAKQDEVLAAWAGLGYYARARNLHAAAKMVAQRWAANFPPPPKACARCPAWAATPRAPSPPSPMTKNRRRWTPMPSG